MKTDMLFDEESYVRLSPEERDRRYKLIKSMMEKNNISVLIVSSNAAYPGHVRYLADYRPHSGYAYVVFPYEEEPTIFVRSPIQQQVAATRWIEDSIFSSNPADAIIKKIEKFDFSGKTIGLVGTDNLSFKIYNQIKKELHPVTFVDVTKEITDIRMVKSEEEIAIVRQCAKITDQLFSRVKETAKIGMRELDVYAEMEYFMRKKGIEGAFNLITSGLFPFAPYIVPTDRKLGSGDNLLLELTPQYQGYYTQLTILLTLEEPSPKMKELFEIIFQAQAAGLEQLKPGNLASDVGSAIKGVIEKAGYSMPYSGGHSLGHEHWEPPVLIPGDKTMLKSGMTLVVHPSLTNQNNERTFLGDTYLVTESGWEQLHKSLNTFKV